MKLHKSKAVNFQKDKIMKTLVVKSTIFLSFLFALMSCVNDDTLEHLKVTTVKTLYAPDNNKAVKLEALRLPIFCSNGNRPKQKTVVW